MEQLLFQNLTALFSIGAQVIIGVALADFISGTLHWLEDSYGDEEWPILGHYVIQPNLHHHTSPSEFVQGSYWMRNRSVLVIAALVGGIFWALNWVNIVTITALIVGSHANEIHSWAHKPSGKVSKLIRFGQKHGILLGAFHHWQHHKDNLDTHYCTITNFVNPVLDRLKVFRAIERTVWLISGHSPRDREIYV
jgi:hypothetical protein